MVATTYNSIEVAQLLIHRGANMDMQNVSIVPIVLIICV